VRKTISNLEQPITLTPAVFHVLIVLADGERHGYAILREIEEIAAGQVRLGPTTLYRSIRLMLESGLIEESEERPAPDLDDERRRYYRITDVGFKAAREEAGRLAMLLKVAQAKKLIPKTTGTGGR